MADDAIPQIPLPRAVLCVTCNVVTIAVNHHCPVCSASGEGLLSLANVLNRAEQERKS